ncbi:hypothetical protein PR202_ga26486 [Eleusine coracana subsp. coracana]|uniref:Coatomer subunit gamma n=1 Tax=Eleusine coracana subsp. coracana TaxID=191504 RepID=A0AAV5DDV5_ELECO|nr:hypothetical protein PR202_ga26486 [Eleusine coracana subsp. coracana]
MPRSLVGGDLAVPDMAQPYMKKDDDDEDGHHQAIIFAQSRRDTHKGEATEVFFATTKLFQSKDAGLRRLVYLMIKELSPSSDEVIIVTSSLMKDMNSKTDMYRANAIRVLCRIIDGSLLTQIERYLKQAIVDKNPAVASAALVSGIHLVQANPEIVKRWSNEVQEAVQSRSALVQFHGLALLHQIRQNDRLAISKLVSGLTRGTIRSPLAQCLLIRYASQVAMTRPLAVTNCNSELGSLLSDQNRSIATLAITTLLKTGNESSIDRLVKQITSFMSDIADEFKIVVVEAIRSLCLKFPLKYRSMLNFLSSSLREEGGFEYKKAIVDSIVTLISQIPDAKEIGLLHLCEFIEDCEFTYLSSQILHFLGKEGPRTSDPSIYIRYIYNRVILENATVRASAVSTLAKFGALVDTLKPRIFVLLRRCLFDTEDEVRDRATLYLQTLGGEVAVGANEKDVKDFLFGSFDVPLANFEASLRTYEPSQKPFDISMVSREVKSHPIQEKKAPGKQPHGAGATPAPVSAVVSYQKMLSSIPEFSGFGRLFKVDASTGEAEEDGVEDEYQIEDFEITAADYMLKVAVSNFRNAWENMDLDSERVDEYGLGVRESLAEAVSAVINILGMQPCERQQYQNFNLRIEKSALLDTLFMCFFVGLGYPVDLKYGGTEVVPKNARSHTCLLSGVFIGDVKVLVRLSFGLSGPNEVAMKLAVRSDDPDVSDKIHEIVASG